MRYYIVLETRDGFIKELEVPECPPRDYKVRRYERLGVPLDNVSIPNEGIRTTEINFCLKVDFKALGYHIFYYRE